MELFEIWTDHKNLKYFREPHKLNGWQARWYLKLQDYNFILWHILGKTITKADILSRKNQVNTKDNNKNVQVLKKELWTRKTMAEVMMLKRNQTTDNLDLLEEIRRNNTREQECQSWKQWTLTIFIFIFIFIFILFLIYFPFSLFLKTKVGVRMTRSHCHTISHMITSHEIHRRM